MKKIIFIIGIFWITTSFANDTIDRVHIKKILKEKKISHLIYISKTSFKLFVVDKSLKILDETKIAYGSNPDQKPKIYSGDHRTPEGLYKIIEILRNDMPTTSWQYKKLKKMNSVYFYAKYGHSKWNKPKENLGKEAYGYGFFRLNYPNSQDKKRYIRFFKKGLIPKKRNGQYPGFGGGIAIHGTNDPDSIGHLASTGCIRVLNSELKRIAPYLQYGTYVYIVH